MRAEHELFSASPRLYCFCGASSRQACRSEWWSRLDSNWEISTGAESSALREAPLPVSAEVSEAAWRESFAFARAFEDIGEGVETFWFGVALHRGA